MPKKPSNALNPKQAVSLNKPGVYGDGNSLQLKIDDKGNKRWIQRMSLSGKTVMKGLGGCPGLPSRGSENRRRQPEGQGQDGAGVTHRGRARGCLVAVGR